MYFSYKMYLKQNKQNRLQKPVITLKYVNTKTNQVMESVDSI